MRNIAFEQDVTLFQPFGMSHDAVHTVLVRKIVADWLIACGCDDIFQLSETFLEQFELASVPCSLVV